MVLLDVNALVALAWDSHVHHEEIRRWFKAEANSGWATCPATESGFVRVSSNPVVLPHPIEVAAAIDVLAQFRDHPSHAFLPDDVSPVDPDFPPVSGYRQVTDAHLLAIARRNSIPLLTFDRAISELAKPEEAVILSRR